MAQYKLTLLTDSNLVLVKKDNVIIGTLNHLVNINVLPPIQPSLNEIIEISSHYRSLQIRCEHTDIIEPAHTTVTDLVDKLAPLFIK